MKKSRYLLAPLAVLAVFAASCSDKKDSSNTTSKPADSTAASTGESTAPADPTATSDTVEVTQGEDVTIAIITHGDGGVFWSVAQKGAETAGSDLGIKVQYQGANNDGAAQAQLIDAAVAAGVDGIAISLADPSALEASVKAAVEAGIPVITMNSGSDLFKELGAITHVGQDEFVAGQGAGEKFEAAGATKILCVMQEQANVGLEARCDGAADTFSGEVVKINTAGDADTTTSQSEIQAALAADSSIDAVFATGPIGAVLAKNAAAELGLDVTIGSVDLSEELLAAIESGEIAFTIDQQQYLQGYLAVVFLYLNVINANTVGGGLPVYTGPGFVTKDNVADVKALVAEGTR